MFEIKTPNEFNNIIDFTRHFKDRETCLEYIEWWRWKGHIRCLYCGHDKIYRFKLGNKFKCGNCKEYFYTTTGTIFSSTKLPLPKFMLALFLISSHKRGISSCQLARDLEITQKSAWLLGHKIRELLKQDGVKLEGTVSSDETFVGGKNKNRHYDKKVLYSHRTTRDSPDKVPVLGMMEKNGSVKTAVIPNTLGDSIIPIITDSIKEGSRWVTDNYFDVKKLKERYKREVAKHHLYQYKSPRGYSTNNIENFWTHFKNMIRGTYYKLSAKHLQRYCDEQTFRFNTRKEKEGSRFALLMERISVPLTYNKLVYGQT
ncbi:IS1595 family transposase [Ferruginibacter albus]|uniref:IS1595 family transposase n=1 Tax=Ferruginibacter albus TaxID=2875540 RepID=UPI001CC50078|nr:IS1595 family transposase [Ferruginibacter albus]UAY53427.1 IS1595 family transposase [Ferruginibacter albus]